MAEPCGLEKVFMGKDKRLATAISGEAGIEFYGNVCGFWFGPAFGLEEMNEARQGFVLLVHAAARARAFKIKMKLCRLD